MYSIIYIIVLTYATATFAVCCFASGVNWLPMVNTYRLQNIDVQDYLVAIGKESGGKMS